MKQEEKRKLLVTCALPYANGPIHIGHLVEHIQTDIWVRFQRLRQNEVMFLCADDAHGTPIMIKAKQEGITPEKLISQFHTEHRKDFAGFGISFDHYYSTHSEENKELSESIYKKAKDNGFIVSRTIEQAYDSVENMFLPDRLIRGICPKCKAEDQYGDNCEVCGTTYDSTDLIDPRSSLSDTKPVLKKTKHLFFDLPACEEFLKIWTNQDGRLQKEMRNKLSEWFTSGLKQWDITRDAPYFGFTIPDTNNEKYFYVWVDAPVGYMAACKNYCMLNDIDFEPWWDANSENEVHHFVGKDILYFHSLFWPAMLHVANLKLPNKIHAHGFLTINGNKMSKSKGTFIRAQTWLKHLEPEPLRYVFASRLNSKVEDMDLKLEEFENKFNGDVVGKIVNIASRSSGFLQKIYSNQLTSLDSEGTLLLKEFLVSKDQIAEDYENKEFASVVRKISYLADLVNQYINNHQPWKIAKLIEDDTEKRTQLHIILSTAVQTFACLIVYLKPILPILSQKSEAYLNVKNLNWSHLELDRVLPNNHLLNPFENLCQRVKQEQVQKVVEEEKEYLL